MGERGAGRRVEVGIEHHEERIVRRQFVRRPSTRTRGTGAVIVWDEGERELVTEEPDHVVVRPEGSKLRGGFALTRTDGRRWVLVKMRDDEARPGSDVVAEAPASVRSGRTWQEVAGR
jgi:hypothetical protein